MKIKSEGAMQTSEKTRRALVILAIAWIVACQEPPQAAIDTSRAAIAAAENADAAKYAQSELSAAQEALRAADTEVAAQAENFALLRNYEKAIELYAEAQDKAEAASKAAVHSKAKAKAEAEAAIAAAEAAMREAQAEAASIRSNKRRTLRTVQVFYGTNRGRNVSCSGTKGVALWDSKGSCLPNGFYGGSPAPVLSVGLQEGLEVGSLVVSFPPSHEKGKIERPPRLVYYTLRRENPEKDVVISELRSFGSDFSGWADQVRGLGRKQAFIYVHGFETSFDQAARRAAQISFDLDFDLKEDFNGVPMLFSWPSRGGIESYALDYDASFESIGAFNYFLNLINGQTGIERVHIVAHSMGNRVVTEALLARMERAAEPTTVVDQLVLAAPDVWATRFKDRLLQTLPRLASRVTLYVSDRDRALIAAKLARAGEPRAGEVAGGMLQASRGIERFDAVDASTLETDFLGHSYYASSPSMLSDIYCLLKGAPASHRAFLTTVDLTLKFRIASELASIKSASCVFP